MKTLFIFIQIGAKMNDTLTSFQLFVFWSIVILFITLFIFFLYRTDKYIKTVNVAEPVSESVKIGQVSDEEAAAIALAIHMYKVEMHDKESLTITLKKVSRIYSPWSSKIYTLRQNPR
jgi:hypothetical protein